MNIVIVKNDEYVSVRISNENDIIDCHNDHDLKSPFDWDIESERDLSSSEMHEISRMLSDVIPKLILESELKL